MPLQRRAGVIVFQINGEIMDAKGSFTYSLGLPKREVMMGADLRAHGYKEAPQVPFIEGKITDRQTLDVAAMLNMVGGTVTLQLANGKAIVLRDALFAGEGNATTEEGEIDVRYEGASCEEVPA